MMDIPEENIFEFQNISHKKIETFLEDFKQTVVAFTMKLKTNTGIGGRDLTQGVPWIRLRSCVDI